MSDTPTRRRGPSWVQLGHGVQHKAGLTGPDALFAELRAWSGVLPPSGAFTGLTVARACGLWLPPLPPALPHFVAMGTVRGEVKPWRSELWVTRHPTSPPFVVVNEVRFEPVPFALLACARVLGLLDVVVLVDSALHLGLCTLADLRTVAELRRRGAPLLRTALDLADGRSESPWETILRMLHVALGVAVTPQVDLYDDRHGFIARTDLLLDGTRTLHEYDGAGHRERAQHVRDLRRDRHLVSAGYARRGYTSEDLVSRPIVVLRDCDQTLERHHDPSRLDSWMPLLEDSLFARWGSTRLELALERRQALAARKLVPLGADSGD